MKLLTVDDSLTMRRIISNAADVLGIESMSAENGFEALDVLDDHYKEISLILLDWNMPGMDGLELLKKIKAKPEMAHIPVMMVTSQAAKEDIIEAIQAGASHYLPKPFAQQDLITKIMECTGQAL